MAMALVSGRPMFMSPLAKLTPIAMPSGRLCRVIASTNSHTRLMRSASGPHGPVLSCSCGVKRSRPSISSTPRPMPSTTVNAAAGPLPVISRAASRPGKISENELAASIMPAAKPSITSWVRALTSRSTTASTAPSAVAPKPDNPPSMARCRLSAWSPFTAFQRLAASSTHTANRLSPRPALSQGVSETCWRQACSSEEGAALWLWVGGMRTSNQ
ncbi:hypothetical protein D3C80_1106730 [compost metagenome]